MVLTDPGRVTPWVSGKGWMRGGPQRSEWPTSREERAPNALAGGRVVRDEYNLAKGHAMHDRIAVPGTPAWLPGGTPAAPGSGQLAFISLAKGSHLISPRFSEISAARLPIAGNSCDSRLIRRCRPVASSPAGHGTSPVTPRTPGGGRHGPDGAGRHLAKPVEGDRRGDRRPNGCQRDVRGRQRDLGELSGARPSMVA